MQEKKRHSNLYPELTEQKAPPGAPIEEGAGKGEQCPDLSSPGRDCRRRGGNPDPGGNGRALLVPPLRDPPQGDLPAKQLDY
jgi:hypothetical protein